MTTALEEIAVTLTASQAAVITKALVDAEQYRRDSSGTRCANCAASPTMPCADHVADLDRAGAYRALRDLLAHTVPHPRKERPAVVGEHRDRP